MSNLIHFHSFDELTEFAKAAADPPGRFYTDERGRKWDNDTLGRRYARRGATTGIIAGGSLSALRVALPWRGRGFTVRAGLAGAAKYGVRDGVMGYAGGKVVQSKRRGKALKEIAQPGR